MIVGIDPRDDGEVLLRKEETKCTYCLSAAHTITQCDLYDSHNDRGSYSDPEWIAGREMVLARRKAKHFGGIPEMYLSNPTVEQQALINTHTAETERRLANLIWPLMEKFNKRLKEQNENLQNR
jgi:hypothetical protein